MRARTLLAAVSLFALLPVTPGSAGHCNTNIYLFPSTRGVGPYEGVPVLTPSAACLVLGEEPNLDVIYPGSDYWQVRWIIDAEPESGLLTFAGETVDLEFRPGLDFALQPAPWWDSQWFPVDPLDTIDGGEARILVCMPNDYCELRVYRTLL